MFQKIIRFCVKLVQKYLPEPFIFAVVLTLLAFIIAMPVCKQTPFEVVEHWGNGVWSLLVFAMQMALVLVTGSALAAAPSIKRGISALAAKPKTPAGAIADGYFRYCLLAQLGFWPHCWCHFRQGNRQKTPWCGLSLAYRFCL